MKAQNTKPEMIIVIVVLSLLAVGLVGYVVYDKIITNDNGVEKNEDTTVNNNSISKIYEAENWIYDADYERNVSADSYSTNFDTYTVDDIVVPFINIQSSDAENANNEIREVFDDAIKAFNDGINDGQTYVDECKYTYYVDDIILSVNLWLGIGATDVVHPGYYTYNFDLETGNLLTYKEVYALAEFDSNNIDKKVEQEIINKVQEMLKDSYPDGTNFDTYINESISNYKQSVSSNSIKYLLDANKKLNVIVTLSSPTGTGEFDRIITVS